MSDGADDSKPQTSWWQKPMLHVEEDRHEHRKVTWLELFYDLVFVVAIAQVAHQLAGNLTWHGGAEFLLLFLPIWWIWIGGTVYNERFESRGIENRVFFYLQMVAVGGVAVFAHGGTGDNAVGFALSYIAARAIILFLWLRGGFYNPAFRPVSTRYAAGFIASLVLWTVSIWVEGDARFVLWMTGLAFDLAAPLFTLKFQATLPRFSTSKMPERFGLFTIIVLGESVVGAISGAAAHHHPEPATLLQGALGIMLAFLLWWTYFDFVARRVPRPRTWNILSWSYGHLPLVMAIAASGAATLNLVAEEPQAVIAMDVKLLFATSVATVLCAVGFLETRLAPQPHEPTHPVVSPVLKVVAAACVLALGFAPLSMAPWAFLLCVLAAMLINPVYAAWVWFHKPEAHGAGHYVG